MTASKPYNKLLETNSRLNNLLNQYNWSVTLKNDTKKQLQKEQSLLK